MLKFEHELGGFVIVVVLVWSCGEEKEHRSNSSNECFPIMCQ